jgi:hypothetical protein
VSKSGSILTGTGGGRQIPESTNWSAGGGGASKPDANPMQSAHCAPRCTAKSKRSGLPCRAPAVRGWTVCRMHGAGGGAKSGTANPNWKHGGRSGEAVEFRKMANALGREARELAYAMGRE